MTDRIRRHAEGTMIEQGYLILADITGYTLFLTGSELDHAQEIITSLIKAILKPIHPPIILHRVEGDAVFAYTTRDAFLQGQTLLESLEQLYFEFADTMEANVRNTTCTCRACANMGTLDLKMVVHYGEFGLQELGPQKELIGTDVNTAHRLLKNNIREATGAKTYLFISAAAAARMNLAGFTESLVPHTETYDDVGEVAGFVYDLAPVWAREKQRKRVFVEPENAVLSIAVELPVPPPLAWDYLNEPSMRARWRQYDERPLAGVQAGRIDVGTTYHCAHGDEISPETILDWRPFDYVTFQGRGEMAGLGLLFDFTSELAETETGTCVTTRWAPIRSEEPPTFFNRTRLRVINWLWLRIMQPMSKKISQRILRIVEEDQAGASH